MNARPIEQAYLYCPSCAQKSPVMGAVPFRCEACGFCNFFGPVAAVGALVTRGQQDLLLVLRAREPGKGKWGLPGGFVDRDESIEEALAREVLEETGLIVTACQYLISYPNAYDYRDVVVPVIDLFFECQVETDHNVALDPDEIAHFEWVRPTPKHLQAMAFHSNRLAIEYWLEQSQLRR